MGRHAENEIRVQSLAQSLDDRYLIGYYNKAPVVLSINTFTGIGALQNGWKAIKDQVAINKFNNIDEKIKCCLRVAIEMPILYYGFTDQKTNTTREEEIILRHKARNLAKTMTAREVDRELYGDEVACIVGKFKEKDRVYLEAIGCVQKKNGEKVKIQQKLCDITGNEGVRISYIGGKGICGELNRKQVQGDYIEWLLMKQEIGRPCVEVSMGTKKITFEMDIKGTYQFSIRKNWEYSANEESEI